MYGCSCPPLLAYPPLPHPPRPLTIHSTRRTAWCVGAMKQSYCGRCVRVTNRATGDSVEMTVVDACGTGGERRVRCVDSRRSERWAAAPTVLRSPG